MTSRPLEGVALACEIMCSRNVSASRRHTLTTRSACDCSGWPRQTPTPRIRLLPPCGGAGRGSGGVPAGRADRSGKDHLRPAVGRARGCDPAERGRAAGRAARRYGIDYPEPQHGELEARIVAEVTERMVELVRAGQSVVLDHGLWLAHEREAYK